MGYTDGKYKTVFYYNPINCGYVRYIYVYFYFFSKLEIAKLIFCFSLYDPELVVIETGAKSYALIYPRLSLTAHYSLNPGLRVAIS